MSKFVFSYVNSFYCLGRLVLTSFILQVASGFVVAAYYRFTVFEAFSSIISIFCIINLGWFLRSLHRWSASLLVLFLFLHIFRVFLTGGFKKPQELIWVSGLFISILMVFFGVIGYSLPWGQVGFWACKILTSTSVAFGSLISDMGVFLVLLIRGNISVG